MNAMKTFKLSGTSDACFYRLFDIATLFVAFHFTAFFYDLAYSAINFAVLFGISLVYLYCADSFAIYKVWRAGKFKRMVLHVWAAMCVAFVCSYLIIVLLSVSAPLSNTAFTLWFSLCLILLYFWRLLVYLFKKNRCKLGLCLKNVAIIGATESAAYLYNEIAKNEELGFNFVGFYDDRKPERVFATQSVAGNIETAIDLAREGKIVALYIALPLKADKRIADLLLQLGDTTVDVHIIPDFLLSALIQGRIEHIGEIDTLSMVESPCLGSHELIKRCEDILFSLIILLLISPLLLLIAIAVKLTSPGPVIFKQDRYGLDGRKIKVWKFRSMTDTKNNDVSQATKNDARVTRVGRFLRRTSFDELPQFLNVLEGYMSIVGPRPHAVAHNEEYRKKVQFYMFRHKAKPGITGWAQVNGWRGETDTVIKMAKRVEYDLHYIKNWSLMFDIKIIFLTIFKGFKHENAY
ncbi:undecaprenyl-phosphate glucose phosphotransferase [Pseudoalteromonas sp.]|uniref:undecaprenyl-phosphate glucose phosphotransferase n=1 Tax=Pseudoalteromonas sp. TaxID=53249 RepID=UPI003566D926